MYSEGLSESTGKFIITNMDPSDEYESRLTNKIKEIHKYELEALRRAGVAKEKEQGLEIESTEAIRLFRQATGYLLRLRELRDDIEGELHGAEYYHAERVVGHLKDYNRILQDIRRKESFENAVKNFTPISYPNAKRGNGYNVTIEGQSDFVSSRSQDCWERDQDIVSMNGRTTVENFVYPRLIRLTKEVENSLIGRCESGK